MWALQKIIKKSNKKQDEAVYNIAFHNFSSHPELSKYKYRKVLGLGLKFIPAPKYHHLTEILEARQSFLRSLKISTYFANNENDDVPFKLPSRLMTSSTWIPNFNNVHDIHKLEKSLTAQIDTAFNNQPRANPSTHKYIYDTLKELHDFKDVIFRPADKNLGITALDRDDYINMAMIHLDDINYYRRFYGDKNMLMGQLKKETDKFHLWLRQQKLTPHQLTFIKRATTPTRFPQFNIMPKVHKRDLSSRPIVGAYEWFTTHGSLILSEKLEPLTKRFPQLLKDSKDLTSNLDKISRVNPNWKLVSFDVVALYPNIVREILGKTLFDLTGDGLLTDMCVFILSNTYFEFNDIVYQQIDGLPMGTNAAVHLANIYLAVNLDPFFEKFETFHLLKRYIDDYFMFFSGDDLDQIHQEANLIVPKIKLTKVESLDCLDVLDLRIKKSRSGSITYETFSKAMNKFQYIPPHSTHHPSVFKSFIKAELQRLARTNSLRESYCHHKLLFARRLLRRGYSRKYLKNIFDAHRWTDRFLSKTKRIQRVVPFKLSWRNSPLDLFINKTVKKCNNYDFIRKTNIRTLSCWKKSRTLATYLRMVPNISDVEGDR